MGWGLGFLLATMECALDHKGVLHALSCPGRDLEGRMGAFQRLEAREVMPSPVWEFFLSLGVSSNIFPRKDGLARGGGTLSPTVVSRRA